MKMKTILSLVTILISFIVAVVSRFIIEDAGSIPAVIFAIGVFIPLIILGWMKFKNLLLTKGLIVESDGADVILGINVILFETNIFNQGKDSLKGKLLNLAGDLIINAIFILYIFVVVALSLYLSFQIFKYI